MCIRDSGVGYTRGIIGTVTAVLDGGRQVVTCLLYTSIFRRADARNDRRSPARGTPDVLSLRSRFDALRGRSCNLAYRFKRHGARRPVSYTHLDVYKRQRMRKP